MNLTLNEGVLSTGEIRKIVDQSIHILEKIGVVVENRELLRIFAEKGFTVDQESSKVFVGQSCTEEFLAGSKKVSWKHRPVSFTSMAEIYQGVYLDPRDDEYKPWTRERLKEYIRVARALPEIYQVSMLGYPPEDAPCELQPLYEKLFCWKYGLAGGTAIWDTKLCPKILEMFEAYADFKGKPVQKVFNCGVFLISPLKMARLEAEQFLYFYRKGLRVLVGALGSLGGTAPVTPAGALSVQVAENLFINMMERKFWGRQELEFAASLSPLEMTSGTFRYGRPEQVILNMAGARIAEYLGASFTGHCGLSDAKRPGHESAAQKCISAVCGAMTCGSGHIAAGLLSVDEVYSPVQMILDHEAVSALRHIGAGMAVDEETLAWETILEEGAGGNFLNTEHTAEYFRDTLWMPSLWSASMYSKWQKDGCKTDVDYARERFFEILETAAPLYGEIPEELEKQLVKIIMK